MSKEKASFFDLLSDAFGAGESEDDKKKSEIAEFMSNPMAAITKSLTEMEEKIVKRAKVEAREELRAELVAEAEKRKAAK